MKRPGRKLCISGKGRCNITNIAELYDFIQHFGKNGRFLHQAFHRFFRDELLQFFEQQGLHVVSERGGRIFPKSGMAQDVYKTLQKWINKLNVKVIHSTSVTKLLQEKGKLTGILAGKDHYPCDAAILATGGASYPGTGSTGDGYGLAKSMGHSIIPIRPSLIPLTTQGETAHTMSGLSLRNTEVRLLAHGKQKQKLLGELLFTDFGLSGPTILTISDMAVELLRKNIRVEISLDLKPALDNKKLDIRLQRDLQIRQSEPISSVLRGLLPREMINTCLKHCNLAATKPAGQILTEERKRLRQWMKDLKFTVTGHRPLEEAIVTAGGVNLKEIEAKTMESKIVKNLYIAGELLDLHGDTGGYNLQSAFSTGWLAGVSAGATDSDLQL
jgi:predicted Rossmann fold flavoprotein